MLYLRVFDIDMKRKARESYSEEDLLRAVSEIKNGTCTYRAASAKYSIPTATLSDKVKERIPIGSKIGKIFILNCYFYWEQHNYKCRIIYIL